MVPEHLWKEDILFQPEKLIEIYRDKLIRLSMLEHAKNHQNKSTGATGGQSIEETKKHFAERFLTSSARTEFVVIDPRKEFSEISVNLKSTFGSGKIAILDIPAGTGAGILALLSNLVEIRKNAILPKLPLHLYIVAGDYSSSALSIYNDLLTSLQEHLKEYLIFIEYETCDWDASQPASTNLLVRQYLRNETEYEEHYVLMSAFSGVGSSHYKKFDDSFKFIQTALSHLNTTILYIEPNMTEATNFLKFMDKIHTYTPWLSKIIHLATPIDNRFTWYDPITESTAKSGVILKQYSRS